MNDAAAGGALLAGTAAPDLPLADATGEVRPLSAWWTAAPRALALVFVRHFG